MVSLVSRVRLLAYICQFLQKIKLLTFVMYRRPRIRLYRDFNFVLSYNAPVVQSRKFLSPCGEIDSWNPKVVSQSVS